MENLSCYFHRNLLLKQMLRECPAVGSQHAEDARSREVKGRDTDTLGGQKTTCMLERAIWSNAGSPVWICWCPAAPVIPSPFKRCHHQDKPMTVKI